jgi:hypothetical protein
MNDVIQDPVLFDRLAAQHTKELDRLQAELERHGAPLDHADAVKGFDLCRLLKAEVAYGRYRIERRPPTCESSK